MIEISNEQYKMEFPDNELMEQKAVEHFHNVLEQVPEIQSQNDLACYIFYMRKCADEYLDIMMDAAPVVEEGE